MNIIKNYTTDFVLSKDGTKIGYRKLGSGPGLILVHGGMMAAQNFMKLAEPLSNEFTVYIPDRRGRGMSGVHGKNFSLAAECEDMQALILKTKSENIFGLSSGAVIALQTTISEPMIKKLALYEPPIPVNGSEPASWSGAYEEALAQGNLGKAMISVVKGTGDDSPFRYLPTFLTIPFLNFVIKAQAKSVKGEDEVSLKDLIATMSYDVIIANSSAGLVEKAKGMKAEVFLLGGEKSIHYLKEALDALKEILPNAKRVELKGLGHTAAANGGKPELVAEELRRFFRT